MFKDTTQSEKKERKEKKRNKMLATRDKNSNTK